MVGDLFRHQKRALAFMLHRERAGVGGPAGGILADDQVCHAVHVSKYQANFVRVRPNTGLAVGLAVSWIVKILDCAWKPLPGSAIANRAVFGCSRVYTNAYMHVLT